MISFFPYEAHHADSRYHQREQQQQQQTQGHLDQHHGLAPDCPRQYRLVDCPTAPQLPGNLSALDDDADDNSNSCGALLSELMQSDAWGAVAQSTPRLGRLSHHRESSLSSLGSTGPASPFASNAGASNPQIAVTDSAVDALADMHSNDASASQANPYYQFAKPLNAFAGYHSLDGAMPEMAYPVTIPGPGKKPRVDRSLLPVPEFAGGSGRSRPASVASSIAGDSPATPTVGDSDLADRRRKDYSNLPKLDRTMTDIYGDELYSPNFAITSTSSQPPVAASPSNDIFSQRIHAANSHHLNAAHSPSSTASRTRSPFRTGSPFAPSPGHDVAGAPHGNFAFNTAQRMREQSKARQEAAQHQRHRQHQQRQQRQQRQSGRGMESETPKTISPKDAVLEFNEADDGDGSFSLFPQDAANFGMAAAVVGPGLGDAYAQPDGGHSTEGHPAGTLASQMASAVQATQQHALAAGTQASRKSPPPRLGSPESSSAASGSHTPTSTARPPGSSADGGTYTCTYHGCTLRFETPTLLQKHKREGHRQTQGLGGAREVGLAAGLAAGLLNTQAGPHRCDRVNPSTGKPCNTVFSRPYDLTRHEDTIHNARKQKVRCDLCTEEKTFSRADALTRHYRVCHPDVELPGKHRRRGAA